MMFLIVGRTASGKDRLANEMCALGMTQVKSRTTRPRRTPDEDTHVFVDEATAEAEAPHAVAATNIAGVTYYATDDDIRDADIYVVDPKGVRNLCRNMPNEVFHVIYVMADDKLRRSHAIARADDPEAAAAIFDERDPKEAPDFEEFRLMCTDQPEALPEPVVSVMVIDNDYEPATLTNIANRLNNWKHQFEGVRDMVCDLSRYNLFDIDEDNLFRADRGDERLRYSLDQVCATYLADDEQLAALTRSWLARKADQS